MIGVKIAIGVLACVAVALGVAAVAHRPIARWWQWRQVQRALKRNKRELQMSRTNRRIA